METILTSSRSRDTKPRYMTFVSNTRQGRYVQKLNPRAFHRMPRAVITRLLLQNLFPNRHRRRVITAPSRVPLPSHKMSRGEASVEGLKTRMVSELRANPTHSAVDREVLGVPKSG